jgi:hypothetical protein
MLCPVSQSSGFLKKKKVLWRWTHLRVWNDHIFFSPPIFNFSCCWVRFPASAAVGATSRRLKMAYFTGSWRVAWCTVVGESVSYQSTTLFSKRILTTTYRASAVVLYALLVVTLYLFISASSHRYKGSSLWNTFWEPLNNSIDSEVVFRARKSFISHIFHIWMCRYLIFTPFSPISSVLLRRITVNEAVILCHEAQ